MTTAKKISVLIGVVASVMVFASFQWPVFNTVTNQYAPILNVGSPNANGEYFFNFSQTSLPSNATPSDWLVFLNFDDGTCWMGKYADLSTTGFTFGANRTYHVSAELAPTYDDGGTNPGRAVVDVSPGTTQTNANWQNRVSNLSTGKYIRLTSTLSPRSGNILTYIVTVQNTSTSNGLEGDVTFAYDQSVLTYSGSNPIQVNTLGGTTSTTLNPTPTTNLKFHVNSLSAGQQRTYFIPMTTQIITLPHSYQAPSVQFDGQLENNKLMDSDAMTGQVVVTGHDPNLKFSPVQTVCMDETGVTFTISFQNDGSGPVNNVVVKDELDYFLQHTPPLEISCSKGNLPAPDPLQLTKGILQYTFNNINLQGLHDPDLAQHGYTEKDTRFTFTFRCALDDTKTGNFPCSAIFNRARVYFDCNPPVETTLAEVGLQCTACANCATALDSTINLSAGPVKDSVIYADNPGLKSWLTNQIAGYTQFKWYPTQCFMQPTQFNSPIVPDNEIREYILVASGASPCSRKVIHFKFPSPCTMDIQLDATHLTVDPCSKTISGFITATAIGTTAAAGDLQWQDCNAPAGYTYQMQMKNGVTTYHFGLTDKKSNCYVEKTYVVQFPLCPTVTNQYWLALLALLGIIVGFLYLTFTQKGRH